MSKSFTAIGRGSSEAPQSATNKQAKNINKICVRRELAYQDFAYRRAMTITLELCSVVSRWNCLSRLNCKYNLYNKSDMLVAAILTAICISFNTLRQRAGSVSCFGLTGVRDTGWRIKSKKMHAQVR